MAVAISPVGTQVTEQETLNAAWERVNEIWHRPGVAPDVAAKVSGDPDKSWRSDSPEMRAAKPVVIEMSIAYAKP